MAGKKELDKYILAPEIKEYGDLQVFDFRGKDIRGYEFGVQLSPIEAISLMQESARAVDTDRVKMYLGGDPDNIKNIAAEVEISMGDEPGVYKIDSAAMTYIPRGVPYRHQVVGKPDKPGWVLSLTLPPVQPEPEKADE